ncbi:MAG: hypothetical protein BWY68_00514 [bacterium ADurb.Bin400]|nr:MAG: hypothetical protein BWY68_00514 [bacterium ADurb.Bin400]
MYYWWSGAVTWFRQAHKGLQDSSTESGGIPTDCLSQDEILAYCRKQANAEIRERVLGHARECGDCLNALIEEYQADCLLRKNNTK